LEFIALHGHEFDVIHTSPPCQLYSVTASLSTGNHPDLVGETRNVLIETGRPYVIENVPGSPLINPIVLCGSMFLGLRVYRHRLFESNPTIWFPPASCNHSFSMPQSKGMYHTLDKYDFITCVGNNFQARSGRIAMQIDWMTRAELAQAIPPAYTKWLGKRLIDTLRLRTANNKIQAELESCAVIEGTQANQRRKASKGTRPPFQST